MNKWSLDNLQNYKNYYIKDSKLHLIGKNEIKTYLKSNSLLPRDYTVMIKFLIGNKENSLSLGIGNGKNKGPNYLFDYTNWKQHQVGYEIEFDETNGKTFYLGKGLNYEIMGGEWYIGRLDVINSSFIDSTLIDPNNKQVLAYYETASDYSTDDYRLHICNLIKYNKQNFIDWIFITNYSIKITQEISSNEIVLVLQDYDEDLKDRILLNDSTVVYINLSHNIVNFKGCAFSILGLNYFRWYIFDQINGINDTCWDLNIYSNPIKAQILIDDNLCCVTPSKIRVESEIHNIKIVFKDYSPYDSLNGISKITPFSKIRIESNPKSADIFINEVYKGKTPKDVRCEPGNHNFVVSFDGIDLSDRELFVEIVPY